MSLGLWIALQPQPDATRHAPLQRGAGTAVGAVLTLLVASALPAALWPGWLFLAPAFVAFGLRTVNYAWYCVALTPIVVLGRPGGGREGGAVGRGTLHPGVRGRRTRSGPGGLIAPGSTRRTHGERRFPTLGHRRERGGRQVGSRVGTRAAVLLGAMALIVAACGDDDDEGTAASATSAAAQATTTAGAATTAAAASATTRASTGGGTGTTGAPTATADNPSATFTAKLSEPGTFGVDPNDDNIYRGAGDFQIDLANCPSDYDINQGITDTEIRVATSQPRSGPLAGFALIGDGMQSYFDYVNEKFGGIDGRRIVLDVKDDAYEPARTKTNVDEMLQSGDYAAFLAIIGTPNNLGVWDETNKECMPQLFNASGGVQWGDVENHPWTTGLQLDYVSEAGLWAKWLQEKYPNGATVAAITFNNDFGQQYAKGFKRAIEGTNIKLVKEELHEAATPNLTNQFTSLAASNADVLLIETSGSFCTQAMAEVEKGSWKPQVLMSLTCQSLTQFFQPLIDQGLTGKDTTLVTTTKDPGDPTYANDPYVKLFKETVTAQGRQPGATLFNGWSYAWFTVETMKLASQLEGGLNRPNLIIANRSLEAVAPSGLGNLAGRMVGLKDAYISEGGQFVKYTVTDPKQFGVWEPASDLFDTDGQLGTYASVQG